jgi:hypothetical protein
MAAFCAYGALNNFTLSSATFYAALSCAFKAYFFSGFLTLVNLSWILATFAASSFFATFFYSFTAAFN